MARSRAGALAIVAGLYVVALAAAVAAGVAAGDRHPVVVALVADLAATAVVFAGSMALRNSSMYDPYWSVAPPLIAVYFVTVADAGASGARQALVVAAVVIWAVRLTANWVRGWAGMHHEDWRYVDLRHAGALPWPVTSFLAVHLFPTAIVFLGCLPLWPALATGTRGVGVLDAVAVTVMVGGAVLELVADEQMRAFGRAKAPGEVMRRGLWARCRHPNYLGEIAFWWGVWLAAVAADSSWWWTVVGPLAMVALFVLVSVPMLDRRSLARRPGYQQVIDDLPALLPLGRRLR